MTMVPSTITKIPSERLLNRNSIEGFLIQHAKKFVWCNPYEDKHFVLQLARISPPSGVMYHAAFFDDSLNLPTNHERYHVFMIGGNRPFRFGLPEKENQWISLSDWTNESGLHVRLCNSHGVLIPRHAIFYGREHDGNVLIAIKQISRIPVDYTQDTFYLHIHSNRKREGEDEQLPFRHRVYSTELGKRARLDDVSLFEQQANPSMLKQGFVNGRLVSQYVKLEEGDVVDSEIDGTILFTEYHRVDDLATYQSTLDKKNKYLLSLYDRNHGLAKDIAEKQWKQLVHYRDDIELFLVKIDDVPIEWDLNHSGTDATITQQLQNKPIVKSVFYPRIHEYSLRHVDHQTYGIPADDVLSLIRRLDDKMQLSTWYIKVIVKRPVVRRTLIADRHRIHALHLFPRGKRIAMMTSSDSTYDGWKARVLEHSSLNYLFRCENHELTIPKILDAYGYDQTALALANPNVVAVSQHGQIAFAIPATLAERCTVFEYDEHGLLLGYYHSSNTFRYLPVNPQCTFIEAFAGHGSQQPSLYYNPTQVSFQSDANYRVYLSELDGEPDELKPFKDITESLSLDGTISTIERKEQDILVVLTDERFLLNKVRVDRTQKGIFKFPLSYFDEQANVAIPLPIEYEKFTLFANGKTLVEGIDYYIEFPYVTIVGKTAMNDTPYLDVVYRAMGFGFNDENKTPRHRKPKEIGFIVDNKMSFDNDYEIHQNQIARITLNSGIINPHSLTYNQFGEAIVDVPTGTIYAIDDHYLSCYNLANSKEMYRLQETDRQVDSEVRQLMNHYYGTRPLPSPAVLKERYPVYSPFISALVTTLLRNPARYYKFDYQDKVKLEQLVAPLKPLLNVDPAYIGFDEDFIVVHPLAELYDEPIKVHYRIYAIIDHVMKTYLKSTLELEPWFKVTRTRNGGNE